jgi:DNA-binding beta-propeller fold protein YncE
MKTNRPRTWSSAWIRLTVVAAAALLTGHAAASQTGGWHVVKDWPKLPPGKELGQVSGVSTDAKDNVYLLDRDSGDIWKFTVRGEFLSVFLQKVALLGHALQVDRDGNVWTIDRGGNQVKKFSPDGKLLLTLGQFGIAGDTSATFDEPTDVKVVANGDVFVTDGYNNHRVVKFNKDGKFVKAWGSLGKGPGEFRLPHAIVLDALGRLQVTDYCGLAVTGCTDHRIEVFDTDGKFLEERPAKALAMAASPDGERLYVPDGNRVLIVEARTGKQLDVVDGAGGHNLAVDSMGDLYGNNRKWSRSPEQ